MGLDSGRSIGMPKIIIRKIFKVGIFRFRICIGGVKFNGGIDMGEGGRERDGNLGGDSDLGGGEGIWGVVERGI